MRSISWQTRSSILFKSIVDKELISKSNGGNAYDFDAAMALSSAYNVIPESASVYRNTDSPVAYWWRLQNLKTIADCRIMEPYPIVFGKRFEKSFDIAMIHHIDSHAETGDFKHRWFYKKLFHRIKSFDKIITVSKYWKSYLQNKGCNNVEVIYNSFNKDEYNFDKDVINEFKQSIGFNEDQPLIYIGNASSDKGVHKVYEVLKSSKYQLVMTGATNRAENIPVKFFSMSALDYRKLIASCDVVITMSGMMEGWNRVAHEAMLSKVPVIGSGSGGMRELLEGGRQQIATNYQELPQMIESCLSKKTQYGDDGYNFVSQFDQQYFRQAWHKVVSY